jgi:hypothetical protein
VQFIALAIDVDHRWNIYDRTHVGGITPAIVEGPDGPGVDIAGS